MKPAVLLYSDPAFRSSAGIEQYTKNLVRGASEQQEGWSLVLACTEREYVDGLASLVEDLDPNRRPEIRLLHGDGRMLRYLWTFTGRPRVTRADASSVALTHSPVHVRVPGGKVELITVHDIHPAKNRALVARRERLALQPQVEATAIRSASHLIAVSKHTRDDVVDVFGRRADEITVVPQGVDHERFRPRPVDSVEPVLREYGIRSPYLLYAGSLYSRKLGHLLEAYALLRKRLVQPLALVLAGGREANLPGEPSLDERLTALSLTEHVIQTGPVPAGDLPPMFSGASVFVYVSKYEGFGMTVLEAMASGVPIVTSNTTALPELVRDAAVTVNPERPDEIADGLMEILQNQERARRLGRAAAAIAASYSWERTTMETVRVYERLIRHPRWFEHDA